PKRKPRSTSGPKISPLPANLFPGSTQTNPGASKNSNQNTEASSPKTKLLSKNCQKPPSSLWSPQSKTWSIRTFPHSKAFWQRTSAKYMKKIFIGFAVLMLLVPAFSDAQSRSRYGNNSEGADGFTGEDWERFRERRRQNS